MAIDDAPQATPPADTPTTQKKRGRRTDTENTEPLSDEDDMLIDWPGQKGKGKRRRKSESRRSVTREPSVSHEPTAPRETSASREPSAPPHETSAPPRDEPRKDDASDDDDESDGGDGAALAEDEFSRQQAIYATQQRNMGYVYMLSLIHI